MVNSDLNYLAELLYKESLCRDIDQLNNTTGRLYNIHHSDKHNYKIIDFEFINIDKIGKSIPMETDDLKILFSICIHFKEMDIYTVSDPLIDLKFNIELFGYVLNDLYPEGTDLHSSWHLDRHIFDKLDEENKFSHPHYHFTFGGNKMKDALGKFNYGQSLILPTPRIAYPPMDAILGIDFIIQNYYNKNKVKNILTDSEYIRIVGGAQERLWKPYYMSIFSKWNCSVSENIEEAFNYSKLLPFLHSNSIA
ncbi:hypothetical protein [Flavobacterium subsaxonicum]|uniref:DUF2290 domain-containing protein n=1 Tax=Flavobacterium subsaxonicum WB 4.1-42 = DSM 21790 TaxID=1121898 RepID=A0A0A2MZP1_9FLAO|nr:hypothetical protein [Flavobacterium subsaxonicum]KGO93655.1 hypothetical protein Q766_06750 [Flavobacterium subsaxonicum WB 4.1-42 = DSM 21790]